jgi:hypothetical protein
MIYLLAAYIGRKRREYLSLALAHYTGGKTAGATEKQLAGGNACPTWEG